MQKNNCIIKQLRKKYQSIFENGSGKITVSRNKIYIYLDIKLNYITPGQVKITIIEFLEKNLENWIKTEPDGGGTKNNAVPEGFLKINKNTEKLDTTNWLRSTIW